MSTVLNLPAWLEAPERFGAARMAHIRYRTRLMALMGAAVTLGLLPNELILGRPPDYALLVGFRVGLAAALFFAALAVRHAPQTTVNTLAGTLGVFLLFLAGFFLFPLGLLTQPAPSLATAYTLSPVMIVAISGVFPYALAEGLFLIAVAGSFFGAGILAGLMPPHFDLSQGLWSLVLAALAVLWMQQVTLRSLAECDFSMRTDALTGAYNRRAIDEAGASAVDDRHGLSVLFIDIDHFKPLNDNHGHTCGDHVIQFLAQLLLENTRGEDFVGRIGGEEFLFLAPRTSGKGARHLAERIRRSLRENPPVCQGREIPVTVSVGIAEGTSGEDFNELVHRADEAMYAAKQAGRDRVVVAGTAEAERPRERAEV